LTENQFKFTFQVKNPIYVGKVSHLDSNTTDISGQSIGNL